MKAYSCGWCNRKNHKFSDCPFVDEITEGSKP